MRFRAGESVVCFYGFVINGMRSMSALAHFAASSLASREVRQVPIPDSWNAAKLFARDHLRKNGCTTPKAGLESVGYL